MLTIACRDCPGPVQRLRMRLLFHVPRITMPALVLTSSKYDNYLMLGVYADTLEKFSCFRVWPQEVRRGICGAERPRARSSSGPVIGRRALITFPAVQLKPQHRLPAFHCGNPRAIHPRRCVAHVLVVTTGQPGDPVVFLIFVVAGNGLHHTPQSRTGIPALPRTRVHRISDSGRLSCRHQYPAGNPIPGEDRKIR